MRKLFADLKTAGNERNNYETKILGRSPGGANFRFLFYNFDPGALIAKIDYGTIFLEYVQQGSITTNTRRQPNVDLLVLLNHTVHIRALLLPGCDGMVGALRSEGLQRLEFSSPGWSRSYRNFRR